MFSDLVFAASIAGDGVNLACEEEVSALPKKVLLI